MRRSLHAPLGRRSLLRLDPLGHVIGVVEHRLAELERPRSYALTPPPSPGGLWDAVLFHQVGCTQVRHCLLHRRVIGYK